jgi:hypothetical protein
VREDAATAAVRFPKKKDSSASPQPMTLKREDQRKALDAYMQQLISCTLSAEGALPSSKKALLDFLKVEEHVSGAGSQRTRAQQKKSSGSGSTFDCKCGEYVSRQLGCAAGLLGGVESITEGGGQRDTKPSAGKRQRQDLDLAERIALTEGEGSGAGGAEEQDNQNEMDGGTSDRRGVFQRAEECVCHFPTASVKTIMKSALEMSEKANFIFDEEGMTVQLIDGKKQVCMKSVLYAYSAYKYTCQSPMTVGMNLEDLNDMLDEIDEDALNVVVITVGAQVVFSFQTVDGDRNFSGSHKTFHVTPQTMDAEVFGTPEDEYWEDSDLILKIPSELLKPVLSVHGMERMGKVVVLMCDLHQIQFAIKSTSEEGADPTAMFCFRTGEKVRCTRPALACCARLLALKHIFLVLVLCVGWAPDRSFQTSL